MSVSGTYDIEIKTPMGAQKGTLVVDANGSAFTGSLTNALMGTIGITDGSVDGNALNWKLDMKSPMPITLNCKATVEGNAVTGTLKAGMLGSMALTGTRAG